MAAEPDLYTYTNYRRYLRDWFDWKKSTNHRFSHRLFARLAGQKSSSVLLSVIDGRRNLTERNIESFCKVLGHDEPAQKFFNALVDLDHATEDTEREDAWSRMWSVRRFRDAHRLTGESYRYLSTWYLPAIRELLQREDFVRDPRWIAERIRPPITASQAEEAIESLLAAGLVEEDEDGRLRQVATRVRTPQQVEGLAVHNYHRAMCERARDAVSGAHRDERYMLGATVCVPEGMVGKLRDEFDAFQRRVLDLCDAAPAHERVFQINLQLFPLSAPFQEDSS